MLVTCQCCPSIPFLQLLNECALCILPKILTSLRKLHPGAPGCFTRNLSTSWECMYVFYICVYVHFARQERYHFRHPLQVVVTWKGCIVCSCLSRLWSFSTFSFCYHLSGITYHFLVTASWEMQEEAILLRTHPRLCSHCQSTNSFLGFWFDCVCQSFAMLGIETRALCTASQGSTAELHPNPLLVDSLVDDAKWVSPYQLEEWMGG